MAESDLDKYKKYIRPVVKTTPKIEKDNNPSGRTNDHIEWKVTSPTGEIHRYSSKKQAQDHFDSFGPKGVTEGQGEQISKTKALNTLRKELMNSYEYMKCANLEEFKHRLQWLSEGMLKNHMTDGKSTVINREEIELYQEYRKKREQIQQGLTKGVDENFANSAEAYRAHLIKTLPQIMKLFANIGKGWIPSKEQMLSAVDTAYRVMKHTGDVKQAGKVLMDELNTLYRMSQGKKGIDENFADGRNPQDKGDSKRHGVPTKASVSTLRKVAKQGGRKRPISTLDGQYEKRPI